MIVRDNGLDLAAFDWFNDYDDTRRWATQSAPDLVPKLDEGFKEYMRKRSEFYRKVSR